MTKKAHGKQGKPDIKERTHVPELDFRKILFTPEEVAHVRGVVAACAKSAYGRTEAEDTLVVLAHLGMMPNQDHWYEPFDKHARRPDSE